ncbi:MAG: hypothetical protein IJ733_13600 [Lachnospiraceae bacterium]|nr:hypothetical protein [Lachnospiraceae bacterium]
MGNENGEWIMRGMDWDNPYRIRTWQELVEWINEVGFLPLFANGIQGFSAEEHVSPDFWWTGDRSEDPWEWREIIAASRQAVYGKFFDKKAGFISLEWLPYFVNYRRQGYDFDARWEDGLANRREKLIMELLTGKDADGDMTFPDRQILSTELKKMAGFGKGGEKNYPGIVTGLQMQTYLVIVDFHRRTNKKGAEYGMPVSVMLPPEAVWGYEEVTKAYKETPLESWHRLSARVREMYPEAEEKEIVRLIGKEPL